MKKHVIVIKFGTSVLTAGEQSLNKPRMVELVRQCSELIKQGHQLVLVSSGAVAAGRTELKQQCGNSLSEKQMLAAIGQSQLMNLWQSLFQIYDISVAQMLLTRADIEHRERYLTARDTLNELIKHNIVPIINENDAVATTEIKVGDNDNLSAMVSILANANKLILLTDQAGLFTADPRSNPDATLINEVLKVDSKLMKLAGDTGTSLGTGGMATKLQAADIAQRAGIETTIAKGCDVDILKLVMSSERCGTTFLKFAAPIEGRKKWLLSGPKSNGGIVIDLGAKEAIEKKGASLLAKGILKSIGEFSRGDLVSIFDGNNHLIAKGLTAYSNSEIADIQGLHSSKITEQLGYTLSNAVIHRDDLVLLECPE